MGRGIEAPVYKELHERATYVNGNPSTSYFVDGVVGGRYKTASVPTSPQPIGEFLNWSRCDHSYSHSSVTCTVPPETRISGNLYGTDYLYLNSKWSRPDYSLLGMSGRPGTASFPSHPSISHTGLAVKAYAKARNNVIDLGEALGELRSTTRWISNTAFDLAESLLAIKRGKISELKKMFGHLPRSKNLAGRWLEYNYAVKPLVSDIEAGLQLHEEGLKAPLLLRALAGNGGKFDTSQTVPSYYNPYSAPMYWMGGGEWSVIMGLYLQVEDTEKFGRSQLGLDSLALTAWNLTPFSLVADWGVKIGEFLEAQSAHSLTRFVNGFTVTRLSGSVSAYPGGSNSTWVRQDKGSFKSEGYMINPIIADPGVLAPRIVNPWSSNHGLSAAALLRQVALGKYK